LGPLTGGVRRREMGGCGATGGGVAVKPGSHLPRGKNSGNWVTEMFATGKKSASERPSENNEGTAPGVLHTFAADEAPDGLRRALKRSGGQKLLGTFHTNSTPGCRDEREVEQMSGDRPTGPSPSENKMEGLNKKTMCSARDGETTGE